MVARPHLMSGRRPNNRPSRSGRRLDSFLCFNEARHFHVKAPIGRVLRSFRSWNYSPPDQSKRPAGPIVSMVRIELAGPAPEEFR